MALSAAREQPGSPARSLRASAQALAFDPVARTAAALTDVTPAGTARQPASNPGFRDLPERPGFRGYRLPMTWDYARIPPR